jgi:predicted component of type VI protein secretion system
MAQVTIQVLEGLERGRVFEDLDTPVTIGREDDNLVQLNDERVSRFHAKLQSDGEQIILTDLDSTNGTRVNGHPVHMRVLQDGDQLTIGRCVLLFGQRDNLTSRPSSDSGMVAAVDRTIASGSGAAHPRSDSAADLGACSGDATLELFPNGPPALPDALSPLQQAQLSDLIAFAHDRIRSVLESSREEERDDASLMIVERQDWQRLLNLEMDLAIYLRRLAEPREG